MNQELVFPALSWTRTRRVQAPMPSNAMVASPATIVAEPRAVWVTLASSRTPSRMSLLQRASEVTSPEEETTKIPPEEVAVMAPVGVTGSTSSLPSATVTRTAGDRPFPKNSNDPAHPLGWPLSCSFALAGTGKLVEIKTHFVV